MSCQPSAATVCLRRRTVCLFAALLLLLVGLERAEASRADGTWMVDRLALRISDCEQFVCGRIVWMEDAAKRTAQCNRTIIWGLEATAQNEWAGGTILDPNDGKTYRLSATYEPNGTLHARIFQGIPLLGTTKILSRADIRGLKGQC